MQRPLGYSTGHHERVTPDAPDFSDAWSFFLQQGSALVPTPLRPEALSRVEALLLGGPRLPFSAEEQAALLDWVNQGGRLLALYDAEESLDSLSFLSPGLRFATPARTHKDHHLRANSLPGLRGESLPVWNVFAAEKTNPHLGQVVREFPRGEGAIVLVCDANAIQNLTLSWSDGSVFFLSWLADRWLPRATARELSYRMKRPQRHRLLHGYPMAPLMRRRADVDWDVFQADPREIVGVNDQRPALLGILPHPFCNPAVRGCGFCTFPHEKFSKEGASRVVAAVIRELRARAREYQRRPIRGVYFGGGTANLIDPDDLRALCTTLRETVSLAQAEVTLEGVPIYFIARQPSLLEVLHEAIPCQNPRISMGVQSFDPQQLARMGRSAYGDRQQIGAVVRAAHDLGYTVSGDLLFNLPGQDLDQMKADVDTALQLGFDQLGLYHLVLFEGLGTEWSNDRGLLQLTPRNERACANWLALREHLRGQGFVQTTLTNFERPGLAALGKSFRYEQDAFSPEHYDVLGFGPGGLSYFYSPQERAALKEMNHEAAQDYLAKQRPERLFVYGEHDAKIFYLTRKIALAAIPRAGYRALFGGDPLDEFPREWAALEAAGLLTIDAAMIRLSPRGMFYADSVAGLLAWRRVHEHKVRDLALARDPHDLGWFSYERRLNEAAWSPMG